MNKRSGTFLAMIVAVSMLANPSAPRQTVRTTAGEGAKRQGESHSRTAISRREGEASRWIPSAPDPNCFLVNALADFYNAEHVSPCKLEGLSVPAERRVPLKFLIATVPDPVRTHLSLFFDRSIDAIEAAAQQAGYVFAQASMPWDASDHPESTDLDMRLAEHAFEGKKEHNPGIMIFRKFRIPDLQLQACQTEVKKTPSCGDSGSEQDDVLIILLVAETPTGGLHQLQFTNSLDVMDQIRHIAAPQGSAPPRTLDILGPTFSGSLLSMKEVLSLAEVQHRHFAIRIFSGTVMSYVSVQWFLERPLAHVSFTTFQESDLYGGCHFLRYAKSLKYKLDEIAFLSEDETAYGNITLKSAREACGINPDPDDTDVVRLYFPREISQMRNAYQRGIRLDQTDSDAGKRQVHVTLPLNLEDTSRDEDAAPIFSRVQTPLSQGSIILQITNTLRAHHTKFVLIRATDPLDMVFLTRYLRQAYPQGRLVTFGADLLFRREVEDDRLHGIMAITSYSLLPRQDENDAVSNLLGTQVKIDRTFPSSFSAGLYNATLALLSPWQAGPDQNTDTAHKNCLPAAAYSEYGWPNIAPTPGATNPLTPALWLTVLGRDAYWPMAFLDTYSSTECNPIQESDEWMRDPHPLTAAGGQPCRL
jgi:hypothetical protein